MATPTASKSEKPAAVIVEKPDDQSFPEDVAVEADPLGRHPWLIERDKAEAAGN